MHFIFTTLLMYLIYSYLIICHHDIMGMECIERVRVNSFHTSFLTPKTYNKVGEKFTHLYPNAVIRERQHYLLSAALLRHPVRAVKWRALSNFHTRTAVCLLQQWHQKPFQLYNNMAEFWLPFWGLNVIKLCHVSLHTAGKETKRGKACSLRHGMGAQLGVETWGCQDSRCALVRVIKLILKRRERWLGSKWPSSVAIHYFSSSTRSPSVLQAMKPKEPFCVNSLIRKTLTSIVPLHFGGKIFHWFSQQSKAGGAERGSVWDYTLRGVSGMGGVLVSMCGVYSYVQMVER